MSTMGQLLSSTNHGCSHSSATLTEVWPRVVHMAVEEQSLYSDVVCREHAWNEAFSSQQLQLVRADFPFSPPDNTTGIGNMAYMVMHAFCDHKTEWKMIRAAYQQNLMIIYPLPGRLN